MAKWTIDAAHHGERVNILLKSKKYAPKVGKRSNNTFVVEDSHVGSVLTGLKNAGVMFVSINLKQNSIHPIFTLPGSSVECSIVLPPPKPDQSDHTNKRTRPP